MISTEVGILPRRLARELTYRDLQKWQAFFEWRAGGQSGRPNMLDMDPKGLASELTGE